MVRNRSYVFFKARLYQALPETFVESKLSRPQMISIAYYILKADASLTASNLHHAYMQSWYALVSGKTATFFIIHLCVFTLFVLRARDAYYNFLVFSLLSNFLFSCAVPNMFMCNVGPHESMQEDSKMIVYRVVLTSAHA